MHKKVTIKDIAERASVSISTVSRVMNNIGSVDADKRNAVEKAMSDLKYRPNAVARSLVKGQTKTIGILSHDIGSQFNDVVARGAIIRLDQSGYSSFVVDGRWSKKSEEEAIQNLFERCVDGIVFVGTTLTGDQLKELKETIPIFVICHEIEGLDSSNLSFDNREGAYIATNYLIDCGHRNIALVTGVYGRPETTLRIEGYRQAIEENNIDFRSELLFESDFQAPSGVLAVESMLARGVHFSAIFCANDEVAVGCRLALSRNKMRVPDDISLVGFDDHPLAAFMMPPLTTVKQPAYELGHQAAQCLINILEGQPYELPDLKPELVIRESVARR